MLGGERQYSVTKHAKGEKRQWCEERCIRVRTHESAHCGGASCAPTRHPGNKSTGELREMGSRDDQVSDQNDGIPCPHRAAARGRWEKDKQGRENPITGESAIAAV